MSVNGLRLGASPSRAAGRLAVLAAVAALGAILGGDPAHAVEGLQIDAQTRYRVEPAARRVRVRVEARLTNTMPSTTEGAFIRTPYFDHFVIPLIGDIANVRARSSVGGELSTRVETDRGLSGLFVDLSPNLVHGTPQTVTVDFDLAGRRPRSRSITRVNAGFASWFVFGSGDPGDIDITIDVPQSFELSLSKQVPAAASRRGDRRVYRVTGLRKLDDAAFFAAALDDRRLSAQQLDVGGTAVTVKAWPDDRRWQRFTARWVRRGLPVLADLVGLDPPRDELTVLESSRTYHHGYAGVYVPDSGTVEVGDVLDESVLLHELSHMWFNDDLFESRWIGEGLAEEITNRALDRLDRQGRDPRRIRAGDRGAVQLNAWSAPDPLDPPPPATEAFGYNAAHAIVHRIVADIGIDGMRTVLAAASDGRLAYALPGSDDEETTVRDWRYFYDLVDIEGGSSALPSLFRRHVVDGYDRSQLAMRGSAKEQYDALVRAGDGWLPPLQLRRDMGNWSFENIDHRISEATALRGRARSVADRLESAGIDADERMKTEYEGASSFRELEGTLDRYDQAASDVGAFHDDVAAATPVTRVGLIGADLELGEVEAAIRDGAVDDVNELLEAASATLDDARRRGVVILLAAALLCALLGAHIARWRLLRRDRAGA